MAGQLTLRKNWHLFIPERPAPTHSFPKLPGLPLPVPIEARQAAGVTGLLGFIPDSVALALMPKAIVQPPFPQALTSVPIHELFLLSRSSSREAWQVFQYPTQPELQPLVFACLFLNLLRGYHFICPLKSTCKSLL